MFLRNIIDNRVIEVPDHWKIHKNWEKINDDISNINDADDTDIIAFGYDGDCF